MAADASSVSEWLLAYKQGDEQAARKLWERYFQKLIDLARRKLRTLPRRDADEDDIVSAVFENLFLGMQKGIFPRLENRDHLWQILVVLVDRRATDYFRRVKARRKR